MIVYLNDVGHARRRPKRLAEKLRQIREALRVSQQEMAQRLDHRLEASTISRYECGRNMPPLELLLAYARLASVSMEQIIDDEQDLTLDV
jgi:transcriptional regulator with XRE-family HTH domain